MRPADDTSHSPMDQHDVEKQKFRAKRVVGYLLALLLLACMHTVMQLRPAASPLLQPNAQPAKPTMLQAKELPRPISPQPVNKGGGINRRAQQVQKENFELLNLGDSTPCIPPEWPADVVHPGIFVVGFGKTGSTYMYSLMTQHPQIVPGAKKEIAFFPKSGETLRPLSNYAAYFPKRSSNTTEAISIDASNNYSVWPPTRNALRSKFPCAKIIFLMRDPTVRWWSSYQHQRRRCKKALRGDEDCKNPLVDIDEHYKAQIKATQDSMARVGFTKELQEAGVSFFSLQRQMLPLHSIGKKTLTTGMYYSRIIEWLEVWPRSQVLLVNTEDYFNPATLNDRMRVITDFAGLPPHDFKPMPPRLPGEDEEHDAPGDYGALPEPYNSQVRAFYEPDLKLLKEYFGIEFAPPKEKTDAQ